MAIYSVRTITRSGRRATLRQEADSEDELVDNLSRLGLSVTRVLSVSDGVTPARRTTAIRRRSLVEFTDRMQILYGAGIPIVDAVTEIIRGATDPRLKSVCTGIRSRLRDGGRLHEALDQFPRAFPAFYRAAIRSGEETGTLERVFARLVTQLDWQQGIRTTLIQTFTYPAILATAVFGLVIFMFTFLLPRLTGIYEKAGVELPRPTRVLMAVSVFLREHGLHLLGIAVALIVAYRLARTREVARAAIDRIFMRLPAVGDLLRKASSATFVSTLHTLHHAGTPMLTALELARNATTNAALSKDIDHVRDLVADGIPLHEAMSTAAELDPLVPRMIAVGERSGALSEALEHVIRLYDREVQISTKRLMTFLEPAILILAGGMVGFIIVATLLPMFRMLAAVKR